MDRLIRQWAEGFNRLQPGRVTLIPAVGLEGLGAGFKVEAADPEVLATPPLTARSPRFGPSGQLLSFQEEKRFEWDHGYAPLRVRLGIGAYERRGGIHALGVWVHGENPLKGLTFTQLDAIFSADRRRGGKEIRTWGDLGLTGEWADKPIKIYGRKRGLPVANDFQERVMKRGEFKSSVRGLICSCDMLELLAADRFAIAYAGLAFRTCTPGVKAVPLAETETGPFVAPSATNVATGAYPLNRTIDVVVDREPGQPVDPLVKEFLKFILSREGQQVVADVGYVPLSAESAEQERARLE